MSLIHEMIHRLWTEKELEATYSDPEMIRADPRREPFFAGSGSSHRSSIDRVTRRGTEVCGAAEQVGKDGYCGSGGGGTTLVFRVFPAVLCYTSPEVP